MLTESILQSQNQSSRLRIPVTTSNKVSGFYSSARNQNFESDTQYSTLADEHSTILEKQKALIETYIKLNGGKMPPRKNIKALGGVIGNIKDVLNESSISHSIYNQFYNLADMLLEGGIFRFGNLGMGGGIDPSDISSQNNSFSGRFDVSFLGYDSLNNSTTSGSTPTPDPTPDPKDTPTPDSDRTPNPEFGLQVTPGGKRQNMKSKAPKSNSSQYEGVRDLFAQYEDDDSKSVKQPPSKRQKFDSIEFRDMVIDSAWNPYFASWAYDEVLKNQKLFDDGVFAQQQQQKDLTDHINQKTPIPKEYEPQKPMQKMLEQMEKEMKGLTPQIEKEFGFLFSPKSSTPQVPFFQEAFRPKVNIESEQQMIQRNISNGLKMNSHGMTRSFNGAQVRTDRDLDFQTEVNLEAPIKWLDRSVLQTKTDPLHYQQVGLAVQSAASNLSSSVVVQQANDYAGDIEDEEQKSQDQGEDSKQESQSVDGKQLSKDGSMIHSHQQSSKMNPFPGESIRNDRFMVPHYRKVQRAYQADPSNPRQDPYATFVEEEEDVLNIPREKTDIIMARNRLRKRSFQDQSAPFQKYEFSYKKSKDGFLLDMQRPSLQGFISVFPSSDFQYMLGQENPKFNDRDQVIDQIVQQLQGLKRDDLDHLFKYSLQLYQEQRDSLLHAFYKASMENKIPQDYLNAINKIWTLQYKKKYKRYY